MDRTQQEEDLDTPGEGYLQGTKKAVLVIEELLVDHIFDAKAGIVG